MFVMSIFFIAYIFYLFFFVWKERIQKKLISFELDFFVLWKSTFLFSKLNYLDEKFK